jgi:hypothetical protein
MIALKDNINGLHEDTCIKVYDPELKKMIGIYANYAKAANKLGVISSAIQQRCIRKTRMFSPLYGKEVACRIAKRTTEDEALIAKCSKTNFL